MKKLAAILLLSILIFNWIGYRFVVDYMQHKADIQLEARLDKNLYDESRLIELKIPIHLPYQTSWSTFERYDGEIELKGTLYKYVERKLSDDTLYLKCLPNTRKMHLENAKDDFFKNTNDLANNNSKKSDNSKTSIFKKIISEYDQHSFLYNLEGIQIVHNVFQNYISPNLFSAVSISPEQPPDILEA